MAKAKKEDADRKTKLREAYGAATTKLREAHRDEFNKLYAAEAEALGVEWQPRLTDEQKAEQQFVELLTKYPALRDRLSAADAEDEEGATG